jgi:hypothetical protein
MCLVFYRPVLPCLALPCLVLPCLALSCLVLPCPCLALCNATQDGALATEVVNAAVRERGILYSKRGILYFQQNAAFYTKNAAFYTKKRSILYLKGFSFAPF